MRRGLPESLREFETLRLDDPRGVANQIRPLFDDLPLDELAAAAGIYASCLRQLDQLEDALGAIDQGLVVARKLGQVWDEANLFQRQAVVIAAQGHFQNALSISRESLYLYLLADDPDRVGAMLADSAMYHFYLSQFDRCRQGYLSALGWLSKTNHLYRYTSHLGLAICSRELGETEGSLKNLSLAKNQLPHLTPAIASKFLWFEGRIAFEVGRPDLSERLFRRVLPSFLSSGQGLEAALAAIELARALLAQGKVSEANRIAFDCRRCLVHLPESSPAASIVHALWQQAEHHKITIGSLENAILRIQGEQVIPAPPSF